MSENTLKTCSMMDSLGIERVWLNTKNRYWYTSWCDKPKALHRILAETYLPNPKSLGDVHHINGNRNDNRLENLEWCTRSRNLWHSYNTHGRKPPNTDTRGDPKHQCIPVLATCISTNKTRSFDSIHDASRNAFLLSKVFLCVNGKRNTHKGYTWKRD